MVAGIAAIAFCTGVASVPTVGAEDSPLVAPAQELAMLLVAHVVASAPGARAPREGVVLAWRPITGEQTVLPVIAVTGQPGLRWLRVMLPGRPNGRTGWIRQQGTVLSTTSWRIVVTTSSRRILVYDHGRLVRSFLAVVGKPSTPTPHGQFFVEESVRMPSGSAGAPFALALSARSDVLQEFDGGPGQIAIHGIESLGGTPGTAVSHGCIRLATPSISWLAARIPDGVPVTITS